MTEGKWIEEWVIRFIFWFYEKLSSCSISHNCISTWQCTFSIVAIKKKGYAFRCFLSWNVFIIWYSWGRNFSILLKCLNFWVEMSSLFDILEEGIFQSSWNVWISELKGLHYLIFLVKEFFSLVEMSGFLSWNVFIIWYSWWGNFQPCWHVWISELKCFQYLIFLVKEFSALLTCLDFWVEIFSIFDILGEGIFQPCWNVWIF